MIRLRVVDGGEIDDVEAVLGGEELTDKDIGFAADKTVTLTATTRGRDALTNTLTGATVCLYPEDEASHESRSVGLRRGNVVTMLLENVDEEKIPSPVGEYFAKYYGRASGFSAGLGEIPTVVIEGYNLLSDTISNPVEYAQALKKRR